VSYEEALNAGRSDKDAKMRFAAYSLHFKNVQPEHPIFLPALTKTASWKRRSHALNCHDSHYAQALGLICYTPKQEDVIICKMDFDCAQCSTPDQKRVERSRNPATKLNFIQPTSLAFCKHPLKPCQGTIAVAMIHRHLSVIPAQAGIHLESRATHGFLWKREWGWSVLSFVSMAIEPAPINW